MLKYTLSLLLIIITGCSTQQVVTQSSHLPSTSDTSVTVTEQPSALQVLKDAGLVTNNDYRSANYIPNSNNTMIVADLREAPCKMIFRYITTSNGDYWMPNQIGCSP